MAKFPKSLPLPSKVFASRAKRNKLVVKAAKMGIKFRLAIIVFELIGVILIQSSSLFLDVMSSCMDVFSSLFLIFCVKLAQRPPDQNHPFGHGRYEPLGGLLIGIFLMILGGALLFQQVIGALQGETHDDIHSWAWIFPAIAMIVLEISYRLMMKVAKKEHSPALSADAMHYRIDSLTSLFAMTALLAAFFLPEWGGVIDHIGAMTIAIFMMVVGLFASRENFHQLMDRIPDQEFFALVRTAALKVKGVEETEKIRIQQYGPDAHVDIDIEVDPHLSVDKAHQISQEVRVEIQKAWPSVRDVIVHIEPFYANDH